MVQRMNMFSNRIQRACDGNSFLVEALAEQRKNAYCPVSSPSGVINVGTAENKIIFDLIQEKLSHVDLGTMPAKYSHYCNFAGNDEFRDRLANLLNHYAEPKLQIQRKNVFVQNGGGPAIETLAFAFCDDGDGILTPAPYYGAFKSDLGQRTCTVLYPVHLSSQNHVQYPYQLTVRHLEQAVQNAKNEGITIKALLLSNPYNPLGTIISLEEMDSYAKFCYDNDLHIISDEMYFFSVFDENAAMKSILSLPNFVKYKEIIHVVWGFSKDFGTSGFRCGVILTFNNKLQVCLNEISLFTAVPTITQYILETFITDFHWLDRFIKINHERLTKALKVVTDALDDAGVSYIQPSGGLFIWAKFNRFMKSCSEEGERELFKIFMKNGIYIAPGFAFGSQERGWFRIVISIDREQLVLAMERFKRTVESILRQNDFTIDGKFDIDENEGKFDINRNEILPSVDIENNDIMTKNSVIN